MTTEDKKPSELILSRSPLGGGMFELRTDPAALADYLDEERERRAKFERDVLERLEALEQSEETGAVKPRCCDRCGRPLGNSCRMSLDGRQRFCAHGCKEAGEPK